METVRTKLVSGDGFVFYLDKDIAMQSGTVKRMMGDDSEMFSEALSNEISFPEISGRILLEVCKYLTYKHKYSDSEIFKQIPDFNIEPELALELMMAADYLDC
ncbi:Elongin-C [Smittium culicis]|uniref:Elongin-C n=1 Tax=Smittium culicis TaxID=133412 RepID=A0A1R1YPJ3_9FUNG|nr:Elongin-C [Smittium culicis]OMJ28755.1 Elongin-C [Smittium culicis]